MRKEIYLSRWRFVKVALALSLSVLFFLLPSHVFAQWPHGSVYLTGPSSYPLRWGEKEPASEDMVIMPPGDSKDRPRPSPGCYKVGTSGFSIEYSVDADFKAFLIVTVEDLEGKVYWQKIYSDVPPKGTVSLDGFKMPEHIEILGFHVQWAQWQPAACFPVFVVLDAPKAPMEPAWVSVLNISCRWARGESTEDGAARKLTTELHKNGNYNGGLIAYTRYPSDPDTGETFYLRAYLNDGLGQGPFWGQCNDFADFLVCLMTSVGIPRAAQRTHSLVNSRRIVTLPNGNQGLLLVFETHPIDAAPTGASPHDGVAQWTYHQFCLDWGTSKVWDGNIAFLPLTFVLGMTREPDYRDRLVVRYIFLDLVTGQKVSINDPSFFWQPTPAPSGFIPAVSAAGLPP